MSRMSDWARRKWAKSRKAAVAIRSSQAVLSEATKARFAHLIGSGRIHGQINVDPVLRDPNLPTSSNDNGVG